MTTPRWNKVFRDLLAHKFRTLLVVLSIAVGIFAVAVMMGGRAVLIGTLDSQFPATNPATTVFRTSPFDEHLVRSVERQADVVAAEGRHRVDLTYRVNGGDWKNITITAVKDYDNVRVGKMSLEPGTSSWPKRGEIFIERGSKDFSGLKMGDVVEFDTPGERNPTLRVSGYLYDMNAVVPIMTGRSDGYIAFDDLRTLKEEQHFNTLEVVGGQDIKTEADVSRFASRIRDDAVEASGVRVLGVQLNKPNTHYIGDIFKAITLLLIAVGVLTLFLSGFLVVNTIGALVTQQTRQIGVMKAVGARARQLVGMYFAMVTVYGIGALVIALPLGQLGGNAFVDFGSAKINFLVKDYAFPPAIVAMELGVGLLVPLLAAAVPVFLGTRVPVAEALRPQGVGKTAEFGHGLLDRLLGRIQGLSRPVALALRNTFVRKGRLALTLTTLSLAAAVFMSVASVRTSIYATVDRIAVHRDYDLWIDLAKPGPQAALERGTREVRGVQGVESWIRAGATRLRPDRTESGGMSMIGVPPGTTYLRPEVTDGRWLTANDKNAVVVDSGFLEKEPDTGVGTVLKLKARGVEEYWTVVGIVRGDFLQPYIYASKPYLDKRLNANGAVDTLVVRSTDHDAASQKTVAKRVADHLGERGWVVGETETQKNLQAMIADSLNIVVVFLVIMAALLAAVGGIGLSGTMSINVLESTREIGVMRAIGARNMSLYQVFVTEGVVVGMLSWTLGLVLAVPMSFLLTQALQAALGFPLTFAFSFEGVALWFAFVLVISVVASLLPAYKAARVSVAEAIAYE